MILPIIIFLISLYVIPSPNTFIKAPPTQIKAPDNRIQKISDFLKSKNSPLASASADFVIFSDEYKIDPFILIGIAKAESNFEKAGDTTDNNFAGFRCTGVQPCLRFRDYRTAVWHLAKTLGTKPAYAKFRETRQISKLADVYLSGDKKRWENTVKGVMEELR